MNMPTSDLLLLDSASVADVQTFLLRAKAVNNDGVRLQAAGEVLAVWVPVLAPRMIGDAVPSVFGMRTSALAAPSEVDAVYGIDSLLERLARVGRVGGGSGDSVRLALPPVELHPSWLAMSAPRAGWELTDEVVSDGLVAAAKEGIAQITNAVPETVGAPLLAAARTPVWSRELETLKGVPAGAAFAGYTLGFWREGVAVKLYRAGRWFRLSVPHGHVVARPHAAL